jgi:ParB-like chromosome segregation protein Spo0J
MAATDTSLHASWPAANIEWVALDDLIPYIRNPRQHSPEQISQLCSSMIEFGWTVPILRAEDQTILAGHGRVMAAKKLGWTNAPVMTAHGWSEAKKRAYVIADNKLALNASWDVEVLMSEIQGIIDDGLDIDILGFSDEDLSRMADDLMGVKFSSGEPEPKTEDHLAPRSTSNPEQVPFGLTMLVSQRDTVFEAIQKAKREFGVDHSSEGLWLICRHYLEQQ